MRACVRVCARVCVCVLVCVWACNICVHVNVCVCWRGGAGRWCARVCVMRVYCSMRGVCVLQWVAVCVRVRACVRVHSCGSCVCVCKCARGAFVGTRTCVGLIGGVCVGIALAVARMALQECAFIHSPRRHSNRSPRDCKTSLLYAHRLSSNINLQACAKR